ncbi:DUF2934 domain-containing protein [Marichromatium gracile]|uniref:DUF2934 domain-containing protein n=1 Tax=Marichromatium gracile TaxID=1048 RepID=UPI001F32C5FA|nr:DUF2934 domain-containing protein [Marichromatium gracile]MCF1184989.1 DUF2934 domain-containing protein [Marichromatium gracile]
MAEEKKIVTKKTAPKRATSTDKAAAKKTATKPATPRKKRASAASTTKSPRTSARTTTKKTTAAATKSSATATPRAQPKPAATPAASYTPPTRFLTVDPEHRLAMIREAAYYKAERRGFAPGHEREDWVEAEREIDAMLAHAQLSGRG